MNSRPGVTATLDMAVLLSEPEAWCPRLSVPATYRSGTPRLRSWISDLGFLTTIYDIELNSSVWAFVLWFSGAFQQIFNPQSAFRNRRSGGPAIFMIPQHPFMRQPG